MDLVEIKEWVEDRKIDGEDGGYVMAPHAWMPRIYWLIDEVERLRESITLAAAPMGITGEPEEVVKALVQERNMLRTALIATGRNLGALLAEEVSNEFLALVVEEAKLFRAQLITAREECERLKGCVCQTCGGRGEIGGFVGGPENGSYQTDPCPDCAEPLLTAREQGRREGIEEAADVAWDLLVDGISWGYDGNCGSPEIVAKAIRALSPKGEVCQWSPCGDGGKEWYKACEGEYVYLPGMKTCPYCGKPIHIKEG